jgi:hypothetical protein
MRKFSSASDIGSMAPLGIGLFAISLSFVLTTAAAGSLFILQKRLTNYAEMAALYVTSKEQTVSEFQRIVGNQNLNSLNLVEQYLEDGVTVRITACADWLTPVSNYIGLGSKQICSHASARPG